MRARFWNNFAGRGDTSPVTRPPHSTRRTIWPASRCAAGTARLPLVSPPRLQVRPTPDAGLTWFGALDRTRNYVDVRGYYTDATFKLHFFVADRSEASTEDVEPDAA